PARTQRTAKVLAAAHGNCIADVLDRERRRAADGGSVAQLAALPAAPTHDATLRAHRAAVLCAGTDRQRIIYAGHFDWCAAVSCARVAQLAERAGTPAQYRARRA